MKKIIALVLVLLVIAGGLWWFLGRGKTILKRSGPTEKVSLRLKWVHQAQFAGNYAAADKGYYQDEGLDVDLQPIDLTENTADAVAEGKVDFGISGGDDVILARGQGKKIKAIAVIYKINPAAVISLKEKGIVSPANLVGKKIGIQKGNPIEYLFDLMLEAKGIKQSQIKKVTIGYDASEILAGKVDAVVGYITNEPDMISQAGKEPESILLADYGVDMYADVLFTSDKMISEKPELVAKMVKATIAGWKYAIEHEKEAVDITMKYATESKRAHEEYMLGASIPLIHQGGSRLGVMDGAEWQKMIGTLMTKKLLKVTLQPEDVFNNQFVEAIYK